MSAAEGMIVVSSKLSVAAALERLEATVHARGLTVFWRFDHAANARAANLAMHEATVVFFGDAKLGTALMQAAPTLAIDLPHRALVWADAAGQTWLGYNDPTWLARRHGLPADGPIAKTAAALAAIVHEAAS